MRGKTVFIAIVQVGAYATLALIEGLIVHEEAWFQGKVSQSLKEHDWFFTLFVLLYFSLHWLMPSVGHFMSLSFSYKEKRRALRTVQL